jgi:hypothetical protein
MAQTTLVLLRRFAPVGGAQHPGGGRPCRSRGTEHADRGPEIGEDVLGMPGIKNHENDDRMRAEELVSSPGRSDLDQESEKA